VLALSALGKSAAVTAGGAAAVVGVVAVVGVAAVVTVSTGIADDQPGAAESATTPTAATAAPNATATVGDPWWDELRFSVIAQDLYQVPVVAATEMEIDGVTWGVGVITEARRCIVTLRDSETDGMACAGGSGFPRSLSVDGELTELLWMPLAFGEPSQGFAFAGVAPVETSWLEFETPTATYRIDTVSRPDITGERAFFIFATPPVQAEDGILRAFDATGAAVAEVEVRAPTKVHPMLPPRPRR
jgi:hypothetical protein